LTTDDYAFTSNGRVVGRDEQAGVVSLGGSMSSMNIRTFGEAVVISEGSDHYATVAHEISYAGSEYVGVSTYHIVDTDDGPRIARHTWVGNL
jgi:hypothetical protein